MIYEGKEYVEVLNSEVRTGDLLIVFKLNHAVLSKNKYLKYTSAVHSKEDLVLIAKNHSDMLVELSSNHDGWRTYRYVKDVEETPVPKEQIIPLTNHKKAHDLINQTSRNIKQTDTVNSPSHYNQTKIEAIDIIEDVTAGYQSNVKYHIGNAIKYLIRAPFKNNTVEDLKKAVWYIQRAIEKLEGDDK